jgi:transcriptional regulator with PAS, ATPase and Fis domain
LGETGTGKELVAKALHDLGHRSGSHSSRSIVRRCRSPGLRSVVRHCRQRPRIAGASGGGTLFLDELGAIPLEIQAKLLRVIETKQYTPINTSKMVNADIRIVSAAHERLEEMMGEGKFREDLYFRLNTIMLTMPPLRARRDDITTLYMHYLDVFRLDL